MTDTRLLKLITGVSKKSGKTYYCCEILVANEVVRCYIWEEQYRNIKNSMSDNEQQKYLVILQ